MTVLVIAEHQHNRLQMVTAHAVTAATQLNANVDVVVIGYQCQEAAQLAAKLTGVRTVKCIDAAHYADQTAENIADAILSIAQDYQHIIACATTFGKNIMPRVAALLDVAQISDVINIKSHDTFVHPIYAGNALATVQAVDEIKVLTIRSTAFVAVAHTGCAQIIPCPATSDRQLSQRLSIAINTSARPELSTAKVIVAGGRALSTPEQFTALMEPLADKLGAAIGASRAAVDAGFIANDAQIGQTGQIVAPDLYIAVGISGAIQHLAGIKDARVIVAINKDPDAPIFQIADYGLVADVHQSIPELIAAL